MYKTETYSATSTFKTSPQMIVNLQERAAQAGLDATQLLSLVNGSLEPEQTLDALRAFTSSKNFVEVVRRLNREDAAKLVDVFNQVCRGGLRDTTLTCLTMAVMTRPSNGRTGSRSCCGRLGRSVAPRPNSPARRF